MILWKKEYKHQWENLPNTPNNTFLNFFPSTSFTVRHFIICFRARIPILSTSNYDVYFCMSFTKITETKYLVQYNSGIPIIINALETFESILFLWNVFTFLTISRKDC